MTLLLILEERRFILLAVTIISFIVVAALLIGALTKYPDGFDMYMKEVYKFYRLSKPEVTEEEINNDAWWFMERYNKESKPADAVAWHINNKALKKA